MASVDDALANEDPTAFAIALSNLVFPRYDRDGFAALTPAEQVAYCVDALEREVANGGFEQFFGNSSGDTAAETLAALETIGAMKAAALLREAMACLPQGSQDTWHELSGRFDEYPDDLTTLMRQYVRAHRGEFRDWP